MYTFVQRGFYTLILLNQRTIEKFGLFIGNVFNMRMFVFITFYFIVRRNVFSRHSGT